MHKDLALALDLAKRVNVLLPAAEAATQQVYTKILSSAREDVDYAAIGRFWQTASSGS